MARGIDRSAIGRVAEKMRRNYDEGKVAAGAVYVALDGREQYQHTEGYFDLENKRPVQSDTIFRLFSMSKPITMTALMQLYERGLVYLEDPLSAYIPEFEHVRVAVEQPDGTVAYEEAAQPITIKNLMTMTSGISYSGDDDAGARSMKKLLDENPNLGTVDTARLVAREGALSFQPGTRWKYGFSHDIVGALVEIISGKRYGEYLRENIFEPLQMKDTAFYVPGEKRDRFCQAATYEHGAYKRMEDVEFNEEYYAPPQFESGGGGLVSTVDDYAHFCHMLLNGGSWGSERLLGRKTVAMMAADQLTDEQHKTFSWRDRGYGYALGMRTFLRPWLINGSVGEFGWDGMMGTWMAVDPAEGLTVVYMQNMMPYNNSGMRLMPLIYGALL